MMASALQDPREELLSRGADAIDGDRRRLTAALEVSKAEEVNINRGLNARFSHSRIAELQRDPAQSAEYEAARADAAKRIASLREKRAEIEFELGQIPTRLTRLRGEADSLELGPRIVVPTTALPVVEDDRELSDMERGRGVEAERQRASEADLQTLSALHVEDERQADDQALRARHGLVSEREAAQAVAKAKTTRSRVQAVTAELEAHQQTLASLDSLIEARRRILSDRRDAAASTAARAALHQAASDLMAASASMTALAHLSQERHGLSGLFVLGALDANDPQSLAREFLAMAMQHGWKPKGRA